MKGSHPNITNIQELSSDKKFFTLTTEYCEGKPILEALIAYGKVTESMIAEVMR
jgi:hypothetical protein